MFINCIETLMQYVYNGVIHKFIKKIAAAVCDMKDLSARRTPE